MKKILVTGGAGFIGSAVVRHIIRDTQDTVINLDKLTYAGNLESLVDVSESERYYFEQVDICDRTELDRVFSEHQPDMVMHLAAEFQSLPSDDRISPILNELADIEAFPRCARASLDTRKAYLGQSI